LRAIIGQLLCLRGTGSICCGGRRTIVEACQTGGVNLAELYEELRAASETPDPDDDMARWPLDRIIDRIVRVHHAYVRGRAPIIDAYLAKAVSTHGRSHHELQRIRQLFGELVEDLERHMEQEESVVFPGILSQDTVDEGSSEAVEGAIALAEEEHRGVSATLQMIRVLADDFTPPPGACATWRACYEALQDFERDLHEHIHLESSLLFPRLQHPVE
jgi:regulator of cell morphogenesis and NO signaling